MNASSSLTPQHQSLRTQLQQLEAEMRSAGVGALPPSEQAMASTMPFMYDTCRSKNGCNGCLCRACTR
jgi:uncharacterized protein YqcC (DUF446 family)